MECFKRVINDERVMAALGILALAVVEVVMMDDHKKIGRK